MRITFKKLQNHLQMFELLQYSIKSKFQCVGILLSLGLPRSYALIDPSVADDALISDILALNTRN